MHPDDIVPYYNNPRHNQDAVGPVAESIKAFGFKVPIVVDENLEVITGHTRLKAAKQLGLDKVPVIVAKDLDEDQVRAYRLADNKVAELASWDDEKLLDELAEISSLDMTLFGFEDAEALLDELTEDENEGEVEEDDYDDEQKETNIKPGDIFQLGQHRLSCGDSTDLQYVDVIIRHWEKLTGEKAVKLNG
jgi:site-specific DNA-methyltransferase (adenine-specific)